MWSGILCLLSVISNFCISWVYLPNIITDYLNRNVDKTFTLVLRELAFIHCNFQIVVLRNFTYIFLNYLYIHYDFSYPMDELLLSFGLLLSAVLQAAVKSTCLTVIPDGLLLFI